MPHIQTGNTYPGILALLWYKPSTGTALSILAEQLLRGPSGLTSGERELIAAYVSRLNECEFCCDSHSASAAAHLSNPELVEAVKRDLATAPVSDKMKALLRVAAKVQQSGRKVLPDDVAAARQAGATDEDIHDAVAVAAAFCMYNRYVDGLGTLPAKAGDYKGMGERLASQGYRFPPAPIRWFVRRILDRQFAGDGASRAA